MRDDRNMGERWTRPLASRLPDWLPWAVIVVAALCLGGMASLIVYGLHATPH